MHLMRLSCLGALLFLIVSCQKKISENKDFLQKEALQQQIYDAKMLIAPGGYTLAWSDDFDSLGLNSNRWKYRIGISQDSYQRSENITHDTTGSGSLHINLKNEVFGGKSYTGGGIITKIPDSYGYYEVKAKVDGGYGWHEAFWAVGRSGFDDPNPLFNDSTGRLEIDCFEHFADHNAQQYTYGAIEWEPVHGGVWRAFLTTSADLTAGYHVYAFEYTPQYLNFYFDGTLLKTVDMREVPQHDLYMWLSCIATEPNATTSGTVYFDYIKAFKITPAAYATRRIPFIQQLDSLRGPQQSNGTDLWIQAEHFEHKNEWTVQKDADNTNILKGRSAYDAAMDSVDLTASIRIPVTVAGTYHLWVRSRDFLTNQGQRKFKVKIRGTTSSTIFGTHGQDGYAWQYGGSFELINGLNWIQLYDASQYFARCDKMLLTTDAAFVPSKIGAPSNVRHE